MNHTVSIQKSALWQISIRWHRILFVLAKRIVNTSPTSSVISKLPYLWLTWDIHVHIMSLFISTIYNKISWDTLPQRTHLTFWWHQKAKKKTPPPPLPPCNVKPCIPLHVKINFSMGTYCSYELNINFFNMCVFGT